MVKMACPLPGCGSTILVVLLMSPVVRADDPTTGSSAGDSRVTPSATREAIDVRAATPLDLLQVYNDAIQRGDAAAIRACFVAEDDVDAVVLRAMVELNSAVVAWVGAARREYGKEEVKRNKIGADVFPIAFRPMDLKTVEIKEDGDTATLGDATGKTDKVLRLKKVAGRWKLPVSSLIPLRNRDLRAARKNAEAYAMISDELRRSARDIEDGDFRTAEEAAHVLALRLKRAKEASDAAEKARAAQPE